MIKNHYLLEKQRIYQAERRKVAKEFGICQVCCNRTAMPQSTRCGVCAEHHEEYQQQKRGKNESKNNFS
jgi:hypothetical protein